MSASVTGIAPTGTVNFRDGATSITGCAAQSLAGSGNTRTATCTTTSLTSGSHSIAASYAGDASNGVSSSTPLTQVVGVASTSTTVTSSLNPSTVGAGVTFGVGYGLNSPRNSIGASGLRSYMSMWDGPPGR